ncbi:MAG TPA: hypothetical protein VMU64_09420 [Acidimicrobiales bacterium]|nr:hypothetical protein [Acidimicrobiales bacterium]
MAHETELRAPEESTGVADDQAEPLYDQPFPPAPRAMQVDVDVQETEVRRLDPEDPPLALASAGVVSAQAVIRPAIRRSPASVREVLARAPRSQRLFDVPPCFISDSSWQPVTVSWFGPECRHS